MIYDVIVVGGGHAGCEAALSCSRLQKKVLMITGNPERVANLPCNPSIGGSAKGIVVREIDALGGEMGKCADKTLIQIKMLNSGKGPAVKCLRAQIDKELYPKEMLKTLKKEKNIKIIEGIVEDLIVEKKMVKGVILENKEKYNSKIVILCTGTHLKSDILIGNKRERKGPDGDKPSNYLSDNLKRHGFEILRLKTGTPQRIDRNTIDFSNMKKEEGDKKYHTFSFENKKYYKIKDQEVCHLIYTTSETKKIIMDNLNKSSMYGGLSDVTSIGPRYCPSVEDKIVKFIEKEKHQIFLEPESRYYDDIYLQGFSTSMPKDVQEKMVSSLPGLEKAKILKYAYAIEYDAIQPTQIKKSLESKILENLFTAGQINGTSGYEEAACQGLIAGINAALKLNNKKSLILKRDEAYIGVLIDDLVTKGTKEPYRLLTSRAEFRLLLRHDNADLRLRKKGYKIGLIKEKEIKKLVQKEKEIKELIKELKTIKLKEEKNITLYSYLKRNDSNYNKIQNKLSKKYSKEVIEQVTIIIKYEGYINKTKKEAQKIRKLEYKKIPKDINYDNIKNIATEARQKLKEIRPESIGQATRISGVNPSDISILMVYMRRYYKDEREDV